MRALYKDPEGKHIMKKIGNSATQLASDRNSIRANDKNNTQLSTAP